MRDFTPDIRDGARRLDEAASYLAVDDNRERFAVLEAEIADPALWDDQNRAKQLTAEYANLKDDLDTYDALDTQLQDVEVLHELARDEDDASQEPEIQAQLDAVQFYGDVAVQIFDNICHILPALKSGKSITI